MYTLRNLKISAAYGLSLHSRFFPMTTQRFISMAGPSPSTTQTNTLPKPPPLTELVTEKDNAAALDWLTKFTTTTPEMKVLRQLVEFTFSRSSGPGGQNVNKVNTKATLRCPLDSSWIPRWVVPALMKNSHYAASTHSILITSTVHRSQAQNIKECLDKLHDLIAKAASRSITKGPSPEQTKKIERLVKAEKKRTKAEKMKKSAVKQSRRGKGGWD